MTPLSVATRTRSAGQGQIDPSFVITHRASLSDAPRMYEVFKHKRDECMKVVLTP